MSLSKLTWTKLFIFAGVLILAGYGVAWYWRSGGGAARASLRTVAVERGDLLATVGATGTIEPVEVVDVGAQVMGMIKEFGRDPHDSTKAIDYLSAVEEGTVLARIDDALYRARVDRAAAQTEQAEAQIEQAEADVRRAQANTQQALAKYNQAERDLLRARKLQGTGAISQEDFDAREALDTVAVRGNGAELVSMRPSRMRMTRVVGILRRKGANMMGIDQDDIIVAPWTTIKYRVSGTTMTSSAQTSPSAVETAQRVNTLGERYPGTQPLYPVPSATQLADRPQPVRFTTVDQILVKSFAADQIPQAVSQITELLRERHHIRPGQENDFSVRDMTEISRTLASTSKLIGSLLLAVALISLVVGGVGIMNIMLVSVTERTREIGLRMAVGAPAHMILQQFLVEAVVLCLLGGALGVVIGRTSSILVRQLLHWPTEMSLPAIVAAVGVSVSVGLVFGFYPAWRASRLDPIEALRYE